MLDLRAPGQRYDAATGLNDNYQRDYDPTTGRYLQSDPIGLAGGVSTYGYVEGDPLGSIDPLGLRRSSGAGDILKGVLTRLGGPKAIQQTAGLLARQAARKKEQLQKQITAIKARFTRGLRAKGVTEAPGCENVGGVNNALFSSSELAGVEKAPASLIEAIEKRRAITWATDGSDAKKYLDFRNAEAASLGFEDIILRPNPSKAAVLEEFLHGTQQRLGIVDRLGTSGLGSAETHVKDFMLRHQQILGLSAEDARRLQILMGMGL